MAGHVKNIMSYLVESQTQIYGINFMAENIQYARLRSIFYAKMLRVHYAFILYITTLYQACYLSSYRIKINYAEIWWHIVHFHFFHPTSEVVKNSNGPVFWIRLYLSWGLMLINEPTENSEKANVIEQVTLHKHWNTKSYWHYIQNHFIQWLVNVPVIDFILWLSAFLFVS